MSDYERQVGEFARQQEQTAKRDGMFRRGPKLTGPDYLLGIANQAAERDQPYAFDFQMMVEEAFGGTVSDPLFGPLLLAGNVAQRPLKDYEASPVSIVLGAYEAARQRGDAASVTEVLKVGLTLLAKWHDYLIARSSHPELDWKKEDETKG